MEQALREALDRHRASARDGSTALGAAGVFGLIVPEELGGLGLDVSTAGAVLDMLGEHCEPTSFLETCVIAAQLLQGARTPAGDGVLRDIANGATVAVAGLDPRLRPGVSATPTAGGWRLDGDAKLVLDGASADYLLVAARTERYTSALLLVPATTDGVIAKAYPTIDGRAAADLRFINAEAALLATDVDDALSEAGDIALACLASEASGLMRRLVRDTVAYAREREQFGQPIARFQVIQHRLADMHIQARRATAIAARACQALGGHWAERARLVSAAKVTVADAGRFVGQNAVQLHGGMGMTQDLPVGRCFKRLTVIEHELGSADQHRQRFGRMTAQLAV